MSLGSQFTSVGINILTSKMRRFQEILPPLLVAGKSRILHWLWMCSGNGSTHGPSLVSATAAINSGKWANGSADELEGHKSWWGCNAEPGEEGGARWSLRDSPPTA